MSPSTPTVLPPLSARNDRQPADRLDLARWLVDPAHPLTARVEARRDVDATARERCAAALTALIKENIGVSVAVDVLPPGEVERSAGKAQRVLDLRNA